jgi:hypothetical protein
MTHRLGYLPAPYKGRLASIFQKLMQRYSERADIEQGDVQMLVWGCRRGQPSSESLLDREHYLHGIRDAIRGTPAERVEWIAETHQNAAEALGEAIIMLDRLPTIPDERRHALLSWLAAQGIAHEKADEGRLLGAYGDGGDGLCVMFVLWED